MPATPGLDNDARALREDIEGLKRDMKDLLQHLSSAAQSSATSDTEQLAGQAEAVNARLHAQAGASIASVERQVSENPLLALLIATCVGYLGGRLLSR